jgi:hypothetical protein
MSIASELVAPISVDLRAEDLKMDIVKGIEHISPIDGKLAAGLDVEPGDWVVKTATGFDKCPAGNGVPHVFPVWTGNNQYDALATGNVTVLQAGGFIYKTTKFVAGSYTVGQNLTVKNQSLVPEAAGGSDAIVARVYSYDSAKGIMEIQVLNR